MRLNTKSSIGALALVALAYSASAVQISIYDGVTPPGTGWANNNWGEGYNYNSISPGGINLGGDQLGRPWGPGWGTQYSPDINFSDWRPFGPADSDYHAFGAVLTGGLNVAVAGTYTLKFTVDDGAILYFNNQAAINNSGAHSPETIEQPVYLAAGCNEFSIDYFEFNGNPAVLVLELPAGVTYCPDGGSTLALAGIGMVALGLLRRKLA